MLHDYIKSWIEFENCKVIEKCDDVFFSTHYDNKPQFAEKIEFVKKRKIDCIIAKDFSRFGRDYVKLGNYLEQLFPFIGILFISVNDNYNSAVLVDGVTGNLDVAFKNLIYDYYSREMSKKQKIAWQRMTKQGQYNSTCVLYSYRKSKIDKHRLVIEPEEAAVVREIFAMQNAGVGTTMIAKALNDREILSPSELYQPKGSSRQWKNQGRKCYWTASKVVAVIRDEKYTRPMNGTA